MRKSILAAVLAVVMILTLCAGCGGSKTAAPVQVSENFTAPTPIPAEETPVPTEEPAEETPAPEDTAEPAETEQPGDAQPAETAANDNQSGNSGGNSSGGGNSAPAAVTPEPEPTPVQDKRSVAMDLIGSGVDSLYAAIGSPNSTSYTASCLVLGGEDGFLYYDGFTVETIRRADGSELIYDVF